MSAFGRNLSRDQLNRSWDAVVAGVPLDETQTGRDDVTLLRAFHALDNAPGPDAPFVERLGQQLAFGARSWGQAPHPSEPLPAQPVEKPRSTPSARARSRRGWAAFAATLLLVLVGGVVVWLAQRGVQPEERSIPAVAVEATPATPQVTPIGGGGAAPLLHATFDPATIGVTGRERWTDSVETLVKIPVGESYRQNGPENGDSGISVLIVTTGTFDAVSSGPTLRYRAGDPAGQEIAANTSILLAAGDAWITSMEDLATASNTSNAQAEILRYAIGDPGGDPHAVFLPAGGSVFAHDPTAPELPTGPLTIDVQRVPLEQHDTHPIEVRAGESFLLLTAGTETVRITKDGSNRGASASATSLGDYPPGSYTITRDLSGAGDLYLARLASGAASATSVAADFPAFETLLNATVDPAAIAAGPPAAWNYSGVFPKQGLHPGQSIILDATNWGAGLTVIQVLDGELMVETEGPAQIVRAGASNQELVPGGSSIALATGDAVSLDASHGAELRNDSEAEVDLLTFAIFDAPDQFFPDLAYPENLWGPLTPSVDLDLTQQFDGPVTVSFQRATLDPDQSISVDVGENELVYVDTDDGSLLQFQQAGSDRPIPGGRIVLHDKGSGTYTLTRLQDDPVEITIVRMSSS